MSLLCCVRAVAGPTASSPPCRAWVIRVIVRPSVHSLGPPFPRLGFCTVVGATMPWLCCSLFGPRVVVALFASSSTPPWRSCPVRVVIALSVSSWHCPYRRRPRRVMLLLFAVGPTCRAWAVRVLVDPAVSRLCCSLLGPRVVVRLFASSFGPPCRLRVVVELAVSLPTPSHHPGPICVIVVYSRRCWPFASSFGPPCRPSAARVFLGLALWLCGPPCLCFTPVASFSCSRCGVACLVIVQPYPGIRIVVTSALEVSRGKERGKGKNEPRWKSRLVLCHSPDWPPTFLSPPFRYSSPSALSCTERAHIPQ